MISTSYPSIIFKSLFMVYVCKFCWKYLILVLNLEIIVTYFVLYVFIYFIRCSYFLMDNMIWSRIKYFQVFLFGMVSEWLHLYNKAWYVIFWSLTGLLQSTGWPTVVAVIGNWFGKSRYVIFLSLNYNFIHCWGFQ